MSVVTAQSIFEAAAEETLQQVRQDRERSPKRIKPLLAYLEEHLFDPGLDVNQLKRACGIHDNSVPVQFHSAVGLPPYAYIETRRMEIACRLLRDYDLKIWQIANLLGYSSIQVYSRAFERWSGLRPTAYRRRERRQPGNTTTPKPQAAENDRMISFETLRKTVNGTLPKVEAEELILHLLELYPEVARDLATTLDGLGDAAPDNATPSALAAERERSERSKAEDLWTDLAERSWAEQQEFLSLVRFSSAVMLRHFRELSRAGDHSRNRRRMFAELVLKGVLGTSPRALDARSQADLKAQAWAWVASTRRRALDFKGAEEALQMAERQLRKSRRDPLIKAELEELRTHLDFAAANRQAVGGAPAGEAAVGNESSL